MKILTVIGARPQFIKSAPVSRALAGFGITECMVHTGQHYDPKMSDIFFRELELSAPNYHLGIGSGPHGQQTGRMMEKLEAVVMKEAPDWILVYGDTNSTLAGAIVAAKLHVPVAHVEAGLRSFNRRMPEEVNRVVADHVSTLLFAPTDVAVGNLQREGIPDLRIARVGDVMLDAALMFGRSAEEHSSGYKQFGLRSGAYVLATIHRAENTDFDHRLAAILGGLTRVCVRLPVVLPLHPRTRKRLDSTAAEAFIAAGGQLIDPIGYLDMIMLERNAAVIATDSGGVQKEAFFYRIPCVTLRDETEWVELTSSGWNTLAPPTDAQSLCDAIIGALGKKGSDIAPYGNGDAGQAIVAALSKFDMYNHVVA
jgi:UDP-GlcNAc3NAcA epimerase